MQSNSEQEHDESVIDTQSSYISFQNSLELYPISKFSRAISDFKILSSWLGFSDIGAWSSKEAQSKIKGFGNVGAGSTHVNEGSEAGSSDAGVVRGRHGHQHAHLRVRRRTACERSLVAVGTSSISWYALPAPLFLFNNSFGLVYFRYTRCLQMARWRNWLRRLVSLLPNFTMVVSFTATSPPPTWSFVPKLAAWYFKLLLQTSSMSQSTTK